MYTPTFGKFVLVAPFQFPDRWTKSAPPLSGKIHWDCKHEYHVGLFAQRYKGSCSITRYGPSLAIPVNQLCEAPLEYPNLNFSMTTIHGGLWASQTFTLALCGMLERGRLSYNSGNNASSRIVNTSMLLGLCRLPSGWLALKVRWDLWEYLQTSSKIANQQTYKAWLWTPVSIYWPLSVCFLMWGRSLSCFVEKQHAALTYRSRQKSSIAIASKSICSKQCNTYAVMQSGHKKLLYCKKINCMDELTKNFSEKATISYLDQVERPFLWISLQCELSTSNGLFPFCYKDFLLPVLLCAIKLPAAELTMNTILVPKE